MNTSPHHPQLVGAEDCIKINFPAKRPSLRTFRKWQANGWFPVHKIGHLTFFDPHEVRAALDRRFRVNPVEPR